MKRNLVGHLPILLDAAKVKGALAPPRLHNRMRSGRFPIFMALIALALSPAHSFAKEKKHGSAHPATRSGATQHAASHPNEHPETQAKKRDAEAKKRLAKDRKQQKKDKKQQGKAEHRASSQKAGAVAERPISQHIARRSRSHRETALGTAAKGNAAKSNAVKTDPATASRVHAWVNAQNDRAQDGKSQKSAAQPLADPTDPHTATSADFIKATESTSAPAGQDKANTGRSTPPPDKADSAPERSSLATPVPVVSVVRTTSTVRAQLPPVEDLAAEPVILPTLYTRRGRLVVPPPMKGSHEILIRQNEVADDEGLDRIQNDEDLDRMRASGLLIAIPSNAMLHVDERLPANRRYCRPWTALFLDTLARHHYARFQSTLQLTSAVRTVEFQQQLIHRNGNAAPAEGDTASPHLTGQAIDIGKKGLSTAEIAWLRGYLLPLVQQGKIDVEEEFQQSCFHISVYKKYLPQAGAGRRSIASSRGSGIGALATGLR